MRYGYPVFLDLAGQPCLVIGGTDLAEEKARGLLEAGAAVTVIAPELTPALRQMAADRQVEWRARSAEPADIEGFLLAVACTGDPRANARFQAAASENKVLFNALDDPNHCRFVFPSVHRQGDLVVAISTTGRCPALAVRLRDVMREELGAEYAAFLEIVGRWRPEIARRYPDFAQRRAIWYRLVDSGALSLLKQGRRAEAEKLLAHLAGQEGAR